MGKKYESSVRQDLRIDHEHIKRRAEELMAEHPDWTPSKVAGRIGVKQNILSYVLRVARGGKP